MLLSSGRVIGVNTAIFAGGQNLGFAIPSDVVQPVLDALKNGVVKRGSLGLEVEQQGGRREAAPARRETELAKESRLPAEVSRAGGEARKSEPLRGLQVTYLDAEGPSAKAGVKTGDLILEVDGARLAKLAFLDKVASAPIGSRLTLKIQRGPEVLDITCTVGGLVRRQISS